jgi:hypothetical protein
MNYKIIKDEKLFREFIEWLPDLKQTEKYYYCLFSRSKYCKDENGINTIPHIKSDKSQLKRGVTDKKRMYDKIKQLECEIGAYKHNELSVPQKALALYITVNPREMWKATINSMVKLANCIRDNNILVNPHQEVLSEIQRTRGSSPYVDFDLDIEGLNLKPKEEADKTLSWHIGHVLDCVNEEAVTFLRSRGGMHILIDVYKVDYRFKNTFYQNIKAIAKEGEYKVDQSGDQMIPVVGCTQGDFTPHFINF